MKWLIASDIHGSARFCRRLTERWQEEGAGRLLLLGDILYHGPRNDLPEGYAPKEVAARLNAQKERVLCVRGNCESEVDQMVLDFPVLSEYAVLDIGGRVLFATHGHHFGPDRLPPLCRGDILLSGHTHIPACEEKEGILCLNPGSVSLPKGGSRRSYMTFEDDLFVWKDLETGKVLNTHRLTRP